MNALDLDTEFLSAAGDDPLVVHYQPEVDLGSGGVTGMEALVRWHHRRGGLVTAGQPAALPPSVEWDVLRGCVQELATWKPLPGNADGTPRQLWMRVSAALLLEVDFVERVAAVLAGSRLAPGSLGLELTEETLAMGSRHAPALLAELKAAGVALAIDDFGSWYSALGSLGELPIDAVKLAQPYVRGVGSNLQGDSIVAAVIALAHTYGVRVVAQGVESWSEGARLCELGCDRALGYLFSGPQRPEHARLMLAHGAGWCGAPRQRAAAPVESTPLAS